MSNAEYGLILNATWCCRHSADHTCWPTTRTT
jgi:hypothetical protein